MVALTAVGFGDRAAQYDASCAELLFWCQEHHTHLELLLWWIRWESLTAFIHAFTSTAKKLKAAIGRFCFLLC